MEFLAVAAKPYCTNRPTSRHAGPQTFPAPPTTPLLATPSETIDAQRCQTDQTPLSPLLARPPRMVWRCGLRKLLAFRSPPRWLLPHPEPGRVLRRAAQSPLFTPQPLL